MLFSEAFRAVAANPFGEALHLRLKLRLLDADNCLRYSGQFETGNAWTDANGKLSAGASATAPDGGTAYRWNLGASSGTAEHYYQAPTRPGLPYSVYPFAEFNVLAAYLKEGSAQTVRLSLYDSTLSADHYIDVTWTGGVPAISGSSGVDDSWLEDEGGGWYRAGFLVNGGLRGIMGNLIRARVFPAYGQSTTGLGSYVYQAQLNRRVRALPLPLSTSAEPLLNHPGSLVDVTDVEEVLSCSTVERRRERSFGVVQGQTWTIQFTNTRLQLSPADMPDAWAVLEGGFPVADVWETLAQGKVRKVLRSTGLTISLEVGDLIMDALGYKLPRDIMFQGTGWAGNIKTVKKADGSREYSNDWNGDGVDEGVEVVTSANCADETFKVVFTSATQFDVQREDGSTLTGFTIGAHAVISSCRTAANAVRIRLEGWDTTTGAYASGDTFVFYTAAARVSLWLTPLWMVLWLITSMAGIRAFDVLNGVWYTSPIYDAAAWTTYANGMLSDTLMGFWEKDTPIIDLIQDALKVVHASIFPTLDGRIGLWVLSPSPGVDLAFNGVLGVPGGVNILEADADDDMSAVCNRAVFKYLGVYSGDEAVYEATDPDSPFSDSMPSTVQSGWRVKGTTVEVAGNKYLNRNKSPRQTVTIRAPLVAAGLDLSKSISVTDPHLQMVAARMDVDAVTLDPIDNTVEVEAYLDPVTVEDYAIVGISTVGGTDKVW